MKKFAYIAVVVLGCGMVQTASAAGLTAQQKQAIVSLLQSFGADPSTVHQVESALGSTSAFVIHPTTSSNDFMPGTLSSGDTFAACLKLTHLFGPSATDVSTGGDVSKLQAFLDGSVTGYFGPATETLLERWQSSHGIVSAGTPQTTGYGFVGPRTLAALACGSLLNGNTVSTAGLGQSMSAAIDHMTANGTTTGSLAGTATGTSELTIVILMNSSVLFTGNTPVVNGTWTLPLPDSIKAGTFTIRVSDAATGAELARGAMTIRPLR